MRTLLARRRASPEETARARVRLAALRPRPKSDHGCLPDDRLFRSLDHHPGAGARIAPGRRGAAMVLVLALLAAALVGAVTWRSRPDPVEVAPPAPVALAPAAPVSASQIGAPATRPGGAPATIVVAVAGKVRRHAIRTL